MFLCLSIYFIPFSQTPFILILFSFFSGKERKKADDCGNIMPSTMRLTASLISTHRKKVRGNSQGGEGTKMAETKSKRDEISHLSSLNVNSIETVNDGVTSETIQPTPIFVVGWVFCSSRSVFVVLAYRSET